MALGWFLFFVTMFCRFHRSISVLSIDISPREVRVGESILILCSDVSSEFNTLLLSSQTHDGQSVVLWKVNNGSKSTDFVDTVSSRADNIDYGKNFIRILMRTICTDSTRFACAGESATGLIELRRTVSEALAVRVSALKDEEIHITADNQVEFVAGNSVFFKCRGFVRNVTSSNLSWKRQITDVKGGVEEITTDILSTASIKPDSRTCLYRVESAMLYKLSDMDEGTTIICEKAPGLRSWYIIHLADTTPENTNSSTETTTTVSVDTLGCPHESNFTMIIIGGILMTIGLSANILIFCREKSKQEAKPKKASVPEIKEPARTSVSSDYLEPIGTNRRSYHCYEEPTGGTALQTMPAHYERLDKSNQILTQNVYSTVKSDR